MKKLLLTSTCLLAFVILNAQSLEEIINKYTIANKLDKISEFKTLKITAKTSMMGMEMPVEMWMKNPNKTKTVTNINGQEMVLVFDGEKGYMINPVSGSTVPTEMTADQMKTTTNMSGMEPVTTFTKVEVDVPTDDSIFKVK